MGQSRFSPVGILLTIITIIIVYEVATYGVDTYKEIKALHEQNIALKADNDLLKEQSCWISEWP